MQLASLVEFNQGWNIWGFCLFATGAIFVWLLARCTWADFMGQGTVAKLWFRLVVICGAPHLHKSHVTLTTT